MKKDWQFMKDVLVWTGWLSGILASVIVVIAFIFEPTGPLLMVSVPFWISLIFCIRKYREIKDM